jgi:hypothetical protein
MNDSLADILGIIVDGGTIVYVGYKTGRWVVENRENLARRGQRLRVTITDRLHLSDSHTQVLTGGGIESISTAGGGALRQTQVLTGGGIQSLASAGGGTLVLQGTAMAKPRGSSSASGTLSVTHQREEHPAWEELLWWCLRVR